MEVAGGKALDRSFCVMKSSRACRRVVASWSHWSRESCTCGRLMRDCSWGGRSILVPFSNGRRPQNCWRHGLWPLHLASFCRDLLGPLSPPFLCILAMPWMCCQALDSRAGNGGFQCCLPSGPSGRSNYLCTATSYPFFLSTL